METVRAAGMTGFRSLLLRHGADPADLLRRFGVDMAWLDDPDRQAPYRTVLLALEQAAQELAVPDLGLQLAEMQDLSILGPLSLAVQASDTLRKAILTTARHMRFHTPALACDLVAVDGDEERATIRFLLSDLPPAPQATEHAVAHLARIPVWLSGGAVRPLAIHFRHEAQASEEIYHRHLGLSPRFGSDFDGAAFSASELRRSHPAQNPTLRRFVEQYLLGVAPPMDQPMSLQVRAVLASLLRVGQAELAHVARVLRLEPRILQRRLSVENLTFSELVDLERRLMATSLLQQRSLPLARVGQILGFADQSVLNRACLRWFGMTPRAYRREILESLGR